MPFPSDAQRGIPAYLTKLGSTLFRARYRNPVGDSNAANKVPIIVMAAPGQTANLVEYYDSAKNLLRAVGPAGAEVGNAGATQTATVTIPISAANIVATTAGALGHAAGVVLVADPGAGLAVELVSAILSYTFGVAAYTAGGNITVNSNGGAAVTGLVSAANSLGAASSNVTQLLPLAAAGGAITANKGLNLVSSVAFTNPGTATGTVKVIVSYRIHTL
jgi:hypothetical protein